jgi:hypothetical protein
MKTYTNCMASGPQISKSRFSAMMGMMIPSPFRILRAWKDRSATRKIMITEHAPQGVDYPPLGVSDRRGQRYDVVLQCDPACVDLMFSFAILSTNRTCVPVAVTGACTRSVSRTTQSKYGRALSSSMVGRSVDTPCSSSRRRVCATWFCVRASSAHVTAVLGTKYKLSAGM